MPIQTSKVTTGSNGDLSLDPNGTGKVVLTDEIGAVKPLGVNATGQIEELNTSGLPPLPTDPDGGDFLLVQRGGVQYSADAANFGGVPTANPIPADVTAVPPFESGSGTAADPYVCTPTTVNAPGDSAQTAQYITIANQKPSAVGTWIDESEPDTGVRFVQPIAQFDATGNWSGRIQYLDTPDSTSGKEYDGLLKMGKDSVYIYWAVTQVANQTQFTPASSPTASPATVNYAFDNKYGTVTGSYADTAGALTATGAARFTIGGGSALTSGSISAGQALGVLFDATTVDAAAQDATVSGTITGQSGFLLAPSIVVNRNADAFTPEALTNATASTAATSGNVPITGINCKSYVTLGTATLTSVQASINGAAYAAIPASGTTMPMNPGDTLNLKGTTGATASTAYTAQIKVGTTVGTWSVTNSAATANISQPTITSPVDGATGIVPDINVTSSAYIANNGAGAHTSSDWQVYQADVGALSTSVITASSGIGDYSTKVSADQGYNSNRGPDKGFDGNTQATGSPTYCQTAVSGGYVEWDASSYNYSTATGNVLIWCISSADQITATGSAGSQTISASNNTTGNTIPNVGVLQTLRIQNPTGLGGFSGITVDGALLIDGSTTLTLTDSTNLGQFTAGTAVAQNSGGTPETSVITNVASSTEPDWTAQNWLYSSAAPYATNGGTTGNVTNAQYAYNGLTGDDPGQSNLFAAGVAANASIMYWRPSLAALESQFGTMTSLRINTGSLFGRTTSNAFWLNGVQTTVTSDDFPGGPGTTLGNTPSWYTIDVSGGTLTELAWQGGDSSSARLWTIEFNGNLLIANNASTQLTLTNNTNLANLRVGDYVSSTGAGIAAAQIVQQFNNVTPGTGVAPSPVTGLIVYPVSAFTENIPLRAQDITFAPGVDSGSLVFFTSSSPTSGFTRQGSWTVGGNEQIEPSVFAGATYVTFGATDTGPTPPGNGNVAFYVKGFEGLPVTGTLDGSTVKGSGVVSNVGTTSLTLSGSSGTWALPASAIGLEQAAATGTVGSTSGSTMTLSSATGRFLVTEAGYDTAKKLNKTVTDPTAQGGGPGAPTTEPPAAATYTAVVNAVADTTNLVSYPLTNTQLDPAKAYYARVRYKDNGSVVSPYSDYDEFLTADAFQPETGDAYEGGYFAGQIQISGTIYNLVVAPTSSGGLQGQKTNVLYSSPSTTTISGGGTSMSYGATVTAANGSNTAFATFNWCIVESTGPNAGNYDVTNAAGTGIGGYNDWYIPAFNELQICYFYLKPGTQASVVNTAVTTTEQNGYNTDAVDPYAANKNWTSQPGGPPTQTSVTTFQEGDSNAFTVAVSGDQTYWSATAVAGATSSLTCSFSQGVRDQRSRSSNAIARAIRRVAA